LGTHLVKKARISPKNTLPGVFTSFEMLIYSYTDSMVPFPPHSGGVKANKKKCCSKHRFCPERARCAAIFADNLTCYKRFTGRSNSMEKYVIHVYQRQENELSSVVGIIECVDIKEKHVFRSIDELWDVLSCGSLLSRWKAQNCEMDSLLIEKS
jgi:hypothetical protein